MELCGQNYFIKFKGVLMKQFKVVSLYLFLIVNLFSSLGVNAKSIVAADIVEGQQYVPNFLKQKGHFEKNANGTSAYADSAGTRPVDGTGGAPTLTCTRTTSSPIDGDGSLLITKDAANRQGNGCAIQFTIDSAYKAKVLQIEFDYLVASGTFTAGSSSADSDIIAYIYDVTNSTLIEPSSIKLLSNSTTISDHFVANFQTSSTGTTYNLILHQATTSASAYTVKADNFQVKPSQYVYGTPITDWVSYTPTYTGFGTTSNNDSYWRRVGDSIELSIKYTVGTSTATEARVSLPSGLTFGKFGTGKYHLAGRATRDNTGSSFSRDFGLFAVNGNSYLTFSIIDSSGTASGEAAQNGSSISVSGDDFVLRTHSIPITGWSSSVQVSDGYDGRLIAASYALTSNITINTSATDLTGWSSIYDTTASFNAATGVFTLPSSGEYQLDLALRLETGGSAATQHVIEVVGTGSIGTYYVGASSDIAASKAYNYYPSYSFRGKAGDTIKVRVTSATNASTAYGSQTLIAIKKLQSPTTISATERVSLLRGSTSGQSISGNTDTKLEFATNEEDTHGGWSTSNHDYTVKYPGIYQVSGFVSTSEAENITAGQIFRVRLFVDGVYNKEVHFVRYLSTSAGTGQAAHYTGDLKLTAGQKISVVILSTVACALNTGAGKNWVAIKMVK